MKNLFQKARARVLAFFAVAFAMLLATLPAQAQSDITGVMTSLDGYVDAAILIGVAILLFMLGRTIVRKIAK